MELRIEEVSFPSVISFNFDELKTQITETAEVYKKMVYTEAEIKQARSDRATLRKFSNALETERKRIKAECLRPYEEFEKKIAELTRIVGVPIGIIDDQVKGFEEKKRNERRELLDAYWQELVDAGEIPKELCFDMIFDDSWLNASASVNVIKGTILDKVKNFRYCMDTLNGLSEYSFEAKREYIRTRDLNKALLEAQRMSQIAKEKAQAILEKQEETAEEIAQTIAESETFTAMNPPEVERTWMSFRANLSIEEAKKLAKFCKENGIELKPIN